MFVHWVSTGLQNHQVYCFKESLVCRLLIVGTGTSVPWVSNQWQLIIPRMWTQSIILVHRAWRADREISAPDKTPAQGTIYHTSHIYTTGKQLSYTTDWVPSQYMTQVVCIVRILSDYWDFTPLYYTIGRLGALFFSFLSLIYHLHPFALPSEHQLIFRNLLFL